MTQFNPNDDAGTKDLISKRDVILEADSDQDGAGDIILRTGGVERARISASGTGTGWSNVLGGSLPALASVPGYASDEANGNNLIIGADPANIVPGQSTNAHGNVGVGIGWRGSLPQTGTLGSLTTGFDNTAIGNDTLVSVTSGDSNTAVGADCLGAVTTGRNNVGVGVAVGENITTGTNNIGIGGGALQAITTVSNNIAIGVNAMTVLTTGFSNVAVGGAALSAGLAAYGTVAVGYQAGVTATSANQTVNGGQNTFVGYQTGCANSSDQSNITAIGYKAVAATGGTALGAFASSTAGGAVAIGCDNGGNGASATHANEIAMGTVNHYTLWKTKAAPADASIDNSSFTLWLTDTAGAAVLNIKAKDSGGTVRTATVALA